MVIHRNAIRLYKYLNFKMNMKPAVERMGFKVWVTPEGIPGHKKIKNPKVPQLPTKINSRALMRQVDDQGNGLYFSERSIAFEQATKRWLLLYQTKQLKLMNTGQKYNYIWNSDLDQLDIDQLFTKHRSIKNASHILELSVPVHHRGRIVLESLCYTKEHSARKGRFLIVPKPDEKKIFDTEFAGPDNTYPLLRQSSSGDIKTANFRVMLRHIQSKNIEMVFVIYPKNIRLDIPDTIDKKTYRELIKMPNVLLFKQMKH